jgi:hypothetical protein
MIEERSLVPKPKELLKGRQEPKKTRFSSDVLLDLAKLYWKHLLLTILISLGIWIFAVLSPRLGITVPTLFFMPTLYTIAIAFLRDPAEDRMRAFSFSVLIGFLFFILVTALAPLLYPLLYPEGG